MRFDSGNSDVLALSTVDHNGELVTLASTALRGGVAENAWYRVDMNVAPRSRPTPSFARPERPSTVSRTRPSRRSTC